MGDINRYEQIYFSNKFSKTKYKILEHYIYFIHEKYNKEILNLNQQLTYLDLASGQAKYSKEIINHFNKVTFSEISHSAISFMRNKFKNKKNISIKKIDIRKFILNEKVDIITMASSLSYVDINVFFENIGTNLSPGGYFIFIDTLNSNFIYQIYRNILSLINPSYRSKKVLKQLINQNSLKIIKSNFKDTKFYFCGNSIIFIFLFSKIFPIKIKKNLMMYSSFRFLDRVFSFLPPFKVIGVCKDLNLQIT